MFSEACVSHSVHGGGCLLGVCLLQERVYLLGGCLPTGGSASWRLPVVTSSGDHCSSQYASYWNAFLLDFHSQIELEPSSFAGSIMVMKIIPDAQNPCKVPNQFFSLDCLIQK